MFMFKKLFILTLLGLLVRAQQTQAQHQNSSIKYLKVSYQQNGTPAQGELLFVNHSDSETPMLQYTTVFFIHAEGYIHLLTPDSSLWFGAYTFELSPDSKHLKVGYVAEGHPWLEIIDIQKLISKRVYYKVAELNPYAGYYSDLGWTKAGKVLLKSEYNLELLNTKQQLEFEDTLDTETRFLFDVETQKISREK